MKSSLPDRRSQLPQAPLAELVDLAAEKTKDGLWFGHTLDPFSGDGYEKSLVVPGTNQELVHANDYVNGDYDPSCGDPTIKALAKVTHTQWIKEPFGVGVYEEFRVLEHSEIGMYAERQVGISRPSRTLMGLPRKEVEQAISLAHASFQTKIDARWAEKKLGLIYPSTRELIAFIGKIRIAEPLEEIIRRVKD